MNSFWITTRTYALLLFVLIFLLAVVITISVTDATVQALSVTTTVSGTFKYSHLVVVVVSYALLTTVTFFIICHRFLKVRRRLHGITKSRIPTNDLPKQVAITVQLGFLLVRHIAQAIKPLSSDINHPGWANPDTIAFEGVDLKRAVARTPTIIENIAISVSNIYARPRYADMRQYISFLIRQGIVDKSIGLTYLDGYEKARFSKYGPTQEEYMQIMKHLAAILNQLGHHLHQTIATHFTDNTPHRLSTMMTGSQHYTIKRHGESSPIFNDQASDKSWRSAPSHTQRRNRNNASPGLSNYGNSTHHSYGRQYRTLRPRSVPSDDDVVSLAHSVATWTSHPAERQPHLATGYENEQYDNYDEGLRHVIYSHLMKSRS